MEIVMYSNQALKYKDGEFSGQIDDGERMVVINFFGDNLCSVFLYNLMTPEPEIIRGIKQAKIVKKTDSIIEAQGFGLSSNGIPIDDLYTKIHFENKEIVSVEYIKTSNNASLLHKKKVINKTEFDKLKKDLHNKNVEQIGVIQFSDSQLSEIISILDRIISILTQKSDFASIIETRQFFLHRANAKQLLKDYSGALNDFEKVKSFIQKNEKDKELHLVKCLDGISWNKARMGNYKDALIVCNELIAYSFLKNSLLPKFFIIRGACYKELGLLALAERSFAIGNINPVYLEPVIKEEGDESLPKGLSAIGNSNLGNRYFVLQEFDKANSHYEEALKINPKYGRAYYNIGVLQSRKNLHREAINAYSNSIKYDPKYAPAYLNRGNEYCYISDFKSAIKDYTYCLKLEPNNTDALENLNYAKSML